MSLRFLLNAAAFSDPQLCYGFYAALISISFQKGKSLGSEHFALQYMPWAMLASAASSKDTVLTDPDCT